MKEAKSALAKRLELKNEDDAVRATYSPEIIQQSLAVAQMLEQKGSFDVRWRFHSKKAPSLLSHILRSKLCKYI